MLIRFAETIANSECKGHRGKIEVEAASISGG
jgi:hypothetical protein